MGSLAGLISSKSDRTGYTTGGAVSGPLSAITSFAPQSGGALSQYYMRMKWLVPGSSALCIYSEFNTSTLQIVLYATVITYSGATPSYSATYALSSAIDANGIDFDVLSPTAAVVIWNERSATVGTIQAKAITISGTTITQAGSPTTLATGAAWLSRPSAIGALTSTQAIAQINDVFSLLTISGTSITVSSSMGANTISTSECVTFCKLSTANMAVLLPSGSASGTSASYTVLTVASGVFSGAGSAPVFTSVFTASGNDYIAPDSGTSTSSSRLIKLSETQLVLTYPDATPGLRSRVLSVSGVSLVSVGASVLHKSYSTGSIHGVYNEKISSNQFAAGSAGTVSGSTDNVMQPNSVSGTTITAGTNGAIGGTSDSLRSPSILRISANQWQMVGRNANGTVVKYGTSTFS
jgi:hypothetical protein